jgi:hypothetical protein
MSTKFVMFINPHDNQAVLVNPAHVRTASGGSGLQTVALVMDGGLRQEVKGNLKTVWAKLEEQPQGVQRSPT